MNNPFHGVYFSDMKDFAQNFAAGWVADRGSSTPIVNRTFQILEGSGSKASVSKRKSSPIYDFKSEIISVVLLIRV